MRLGYGDMRIATLMILKVFSPDISEITMETIFAPAYSIEQSHPPV